jgi:murein DD-endopeptidase MepM/ murein hydrolase activator NlpD
VSRLLLFVLGLVVGAAATYYLCWSGTLPVASSASSATQAAPATTSPAPPPPNPSNEPDLALNAPVAPASVAMPVSILPPQPLPIPADTGESATATASTTTANASEATVPTTPDATAAMVAANASGALLIPVQGVQASKLVDTFTQARGAGRLHDAIDIMAARGTPVLAAADGTVAKLFTSVPGGLTIYEFDPTGTYAYYYAHLDRYAPGVTEGKALKRGEVIAYVGSTGNASADAPHLHFAIFVLGPEKQWWKGTAIDPYPLLAKSR